MLEFEGSMNDDEDEVDFVCVGSGVSGTAGAVVAARLGLETTLLEKEDALGGATVDSFGILFVPNNHLQDSDEVGDSLEDARKYMYWMGAGLESSEHVENYLRFAPVALRYFADEVGIPFYIVKNLADHHYPKAPGTRLSGRMLQVQPFATESLGPFRHLLAHSRYIERATFEEVSLWGGRFGQDNWDAEVIKEREAHDVRTWGAGLAGHFLSAAISSGVRIMNNASLERLIVKDGAISGVLYVRDGRRTLLRVRKGVLLGTGSASKNHHLMHWIDNNRTHELGIDSPIPGSWTGEGLGAALEHGAAMAVRYGEARYASLVSRSEKNVEGKPWLLSLRDFGAPHAVIVNRKGLRFTNESDFREQAGRELLAFDSDAFEYTNDPCYFVFDQTYVDEVGLGTNRRGSPVPDWIVRGDTVVELATKLGVDPVGLEGTIERFNEFCDRNSDTDFHLGEIPFYQAIGAGTQNAFPNPQLGKLIRSPFYGLELRAGSHGSPGGLVTNLYGQVIHWSGEPIEGLYASGLVAATLWHGVGYNAGFHLTGGFTYSYLAALHAAGQV